MDIVVHGTKGGRQIFTPKKIGGLLDVSADASKATAIGQEAFAIRFVENSVIFSKYKIIRDVRGDKRTGFLAFSLFLSNKEILQGKDIVSALNQASQLYYQKYIPDNDNNLKDVREEWGFLEEIVGDFRDKVRNRAIDDVENLISGSKDDAFAYYESDDKLERYFDQPYQNEYIDYRQVLFIKSELKDKPESPLNALRHSENPSDNLTGRIDLDKRIYVLRDFDGTAKNGVNIEISIKGRRLRNNDRISNRDIISLRYTKKYYNDLRITEGQLGDNWIRKYISVSDDVANRSVSVEKNIELTPIEKTISFIVMDWHMKEVNGTTITCRCTESKKNLDYNNQITFSESDLGKVWIVSARTSSFYSDERKIDFEKDCPNSNGLVSIYLNNHTLSISCEDSISGKNLKDLKFSKQNFKGSEIIDNHKITILKEGYESITINYCPEKDYNKALIIKLPPKKNQDSEYTFIASIGNNGTWSDGSKHDRLTKSSKGSDLKNQIKANKGWKFLGFERNQDKLIATYNKENEKYESIRVIALAFAIGIVIIAGLWVLYPTTRKDNNKSNLDLNSESIINYIKGDSLILEKLQNFKKKINNEQKDLSDKLDSAIKIRGFINEFKFDTLKGMHFYELQQEFENTILNINREQTKGIKEKYKDISLWDLNKIKDSLREYLETTNEKKEITAEKETDIDDNTRTHPTPEPSSRTSINNKKNISPDSPNIKRNENKQEFYPDEKVDLKKIKEELKKGSLTRNQLENYSKINDNNISRSVKLYMLFWEKVATSTLQKDDFNKLLDQVKEDPNLKNSKLSEFLRSICKSSESFQKFNKTSAKGVCTSLDKLINKIQ